MKKFCILICVLLLSACKHRDEAYYRLHPEHLKQAIANCSNTSGKVSCQQLDVIAMEMNQYIYDLQTSPQLFGRSILELQATIVKQKQQLKNSKDETLKNNLHANQQSLSERLAIVRWLESPSR